MDNGQRIDLLEKQVNILSSLSKSSKSKYNSYQ